MYIDRVVSVHLPVLKFRGTIVVEQLKFCVRTTRKHEERGKEFDSGSFVLICQEDHERISFAAVIWGCYTSLLPKDIQCESREGQNRTTIGRIPGQLSA